MRFAFALTLICFLFGTVVSWAAEGHDGEKKAEPAKEEVATLGTPRAPSVDMPTLVAPVVVNGEMHNYVYFSVTLKLVDDNHKTELLDKIPYLQDAFLREVHGASIALNNDPSIVDQTGLITRLLRVCEKVVGPNIVKDIEFRNAAQATN